MKQVTITVKRRTSRVIPSSAIFAVKQKSMAIFGAGSVWDETNEAKEDFFQTSRFVIGWNYERAADLYAALSVLKAGDIVYLKANRPGTRVLRVKGVGIVTRSFLQCMIEDRLTADNITDYYSFYIRVRWLVTSEFSIEVPEDDGRLTNVRAATFYEEYLPYVQDRIIQEIFNDI